MTTIRLRLPSNLYRPWKPLYRQRSKKQKNPPIPYTSLEQQLYDHAKTKFDQKVNILRSIFAIESQSLSTKSRFAQLQLQAEEQEFRQLINTVKYVYFLCVLMIDNKIIFEQLSCDMSKSIPILIRKIE